MNLPLFIAQRYFFSKKSKNIVNILSIVSVTGIIVGTTSLILILSAFNGLEDIIRQSYWEIDPPFRIEKKKGKLFQENISLFRQLKNMENITYFTGIEGKSFVQYNGKQKVVRVIGVDTNFTKVCPIKGHAIVGEFELQRRSSDFASIGITLSDELGILNINTIFNIYTLKRDARYSALKFQENIIRRPILVKSIFAGLQEYDQQTIFIPLRVAQDIFEADSAVSFVGITTHNGYSSDVIQERLNNISGEDFIVKNRYQQHQEIYKLFSSEKWMIFAILIFIFILSSANIIGTTTVLLIEKKQDIFILKSMGMYQVHKVFLWQSIFLSSVGVSLGALLGLSLTWLQEQYHLLKLDHNFIVDYYPMKIVWSNILLIIIIILLINFLLSRLPVRLLLSKKLS